MRPSLKKLKEREQSNSRMTLRRLSEEEYENIFKQRAGAKKTIYGDKRPRFIPKKLGRLSDDEYKNLPRDYVEEYYNDK